jgi:hypothetical protein
MRNGPDSASVIGNYDTTDTAGSKAPHAAIAGVAPVFKVASAADQEEPKEVPDKGAQE